MALIDDLLAEKIKIESFLVSTAGQKLPDNLLERLETLKTLLGELGGTGGGVAAFVTANAGTNLNTSTLSLESTQSTINNKLPSGLTVTANRLQVELPSGGTGLTNAELRASAVPVSLATLPVTNTGTFAVQAVATLAAETTKVIGTVNVAGTIPVSGTFFQATQPISAASLPLPTLAATSTLQTALNALLPISLGAKTSDGSLSITPASNAAFMLGATISAPTAYRTDITTPDIATPTVGTITTAAGGSLTAVAHHVRVVGVNAFGCSLPVIPAGNGITATASGVIRIPITVGNFSAFDIFMSTATDPLYLGRITASQVTAGSLITAAATASANCSQSTGGTAGVVECRVLGTQRAASTETIPFSFVMPATPINCAGRQFVDIDVQITLTAAPVLPMIVVVPFFLNSLTNNYVQSDIVSTLNFSSTGTSNRTRLRYQVQGNTGVHLAVQSIVGVGASINMWSSVS